MLARLVLVVQFFSACVASLYDLNLEVDDLQSGLPVPMTYYKGKVLLIVNVASQCGFTQSTYSYLNTLHSRYGNQGLAILAFPCNQFGAQEPGSPQEIFSFATTTQSAKFDFFRKVDVNGPNAHPLFKFLRGVGDCSDEERDCEAWAESGECENNKEFMEGSCRLWPVHAQHGRGRACPVELRELLGDEGWYRAQALRHGRRSHRAREHERPRDAACREGRALNACHGAYSNRIQSAKL